MKQVNVKTARSQLRKLLDRVAGGEEVSLLRRGKEVARLVPPRRTSGALLPNLRKFRASIKVKGRSLSAEVIDDRRRQRY
ncbi:MAG: prevent-host-death family protein [Deltaproteobacteria bacterium]|nr:MAG: prevent-host-death family protein [Deltaproteobacteria bacterium]